MSLIVTKVITPDHSLLSKFAAVNPALKLVAGSARADGNWEYIHIEVARADENLMLAAPVLCSGKGVSLVNSSKPSLGWQHEIIVAVDEEHNILGHIGAIMPDEKLRDTTQIKHLVHTHGDKIAYLLRVNVTGWCERLEKWQDSPLGELQSRSILITVFQKPRKNFSYLLDRIPTDANMRLHFSATFGVPEATNPDIAQFISRLVEPVQEFERNVFFAADGIRRHLVANCAYRTASMGDDLSITYTTWKDGDCNRIRIVFKMNGAELGFFFRGAEDFLHLQLDSIDATFIEATELLAEISRRWASGARLCRVRGAVE